MLYTLVKGSFNLAEQLTLCAEQPAPQMEDVYYGKPGQSSLQYAADFHPGKHSTDVLMLGQACAPSQQAVYHLDVQLQLGALHKVVRVFGNRVWQGGSISQPELFTRMPLVYEKAFGGLDIQGDALRGGEARNPVGVGFRGKKSASQLDGTPLPNLECPKQLIQDTTDTPEPAAFGPRAPNWQPRLQFAGTYDQAWQTTRAPYLPDDYSPRFMNVAHPNLIAPGFLQGGEPIKIIGMHPMGEIISQVPYVKLAAIVEVAGQTQPAAFNLETILLEPNQLRMSLVWKAAFPCDKKALKISQVTVNLAR